MTTLRSRFGQVDAVPAAADEQAAQGRLHHPFEADAVGLAVGALDLQVGDHRHAFLLPDALGEILRLGGLLVGADEVKGRPRTGHDQLRAAALAADADAAEAFQRDLSGRVIRYSPRGKSRWPSPFSQGVLQGGGVVGLAVALGTEVAHVCHDRSFQETRCLAGMRALIPERCIVAWASTRIEPAGLLFIPFHDHTR